MAEPTRAELKADLELLAEELVAIRARERHTVQIFDRMDPEAKALAAIVEALKPFEKSSGYNYGSMRSDSAYRVLHAAAARFGITPDWDRVEQFTARLTDPERVELEELRRMVSNKERQMSYDVTLDIQDALGDPYTVADFNYTTNVAQIWRDAGAKIHEWDGDKAANRIDELTVAVAGIRAELPKYRIMNPENKWGDVDGMLEHFLVPLLDRMRRFPDARIRVCR